MHDARSIDAIFQSYLNVSAAMGYRGMKEPV